MISIARRPSTDSDNPEIDTALSGALTFEKQSPRFGLLSVYEKRLNSTMHKNPDKLHALRSERKANEPHDRQQEVTIARARDFNGLPYKAPTWPSRNGYVFSTPEILAAANRETVVEYSKTVVAPYSHHIQFEGACEEIDPHRPNSGLQMVAAA
jgi:hypothetical protein